MASSHEYSRLVSQTLACMGYNKDMVQCRVDHYREYANMFEFGYMRQIITGSKGEGLSTKYQSDNDSMHVIPHAICADDPRQFTNFPDTIVFAMDSLNTPPGYTQLKLVKYGGLKLIYNALIKAENGQWYLSSDKLVRAGQSLYQAASCINGMLQVACNGLASTLHVRAGPSGPHTITCGPFIVHIDTVLSITCSCQGMLNSWARRQRSNNWPAQDLIQNISRTDSGYVVPVGFKGSDNQHKEWRICFTTAELKLIHNLNDTQTKLYVLLKMVAKHIIHPVYKDITSYIMKNVVLWMAESNPQEIFREECLIEMVIRSLCFLRQCVERNVLPSYMIPERNLLARKLTFHERQQLSTLLSDCIQTGGTILLQCEKLRVFMIAKYITPDDTIRYGRKRDVVEYLVLLHNLIQTKTITAFFSNGVLCSHVQIEALLRHDEAYCRIDDTLVNLVVPEWREMHALGINHMPLYEQRLIEFLS